ncbi:hypothetical protein V8G54_000811 [Vigna mungo]|uniref:Uncharacterized protein n=1 Tax=Vigna mungo TaxID=3915 RepID=A0AAQ3P7R7_VIGMU
MADPSTPPPSQSEDKSQSSTQPKRRRATRLKDLTISRSADQRLPIQFDMSTGKVLGDNRVRFTSFVALLGRSKLTYDVPNTKLLRTKWISYVGQRWRCFKTHLTSRYIHGKLSHKNPCEIYPFLNEEMWQAFRDKRLDPTFQEKRKVAQDTMKKNLHPHRLSRGGYHRLEEIMIHEASSSATNDRSDLSLISPPPRHEKWKRARTKPSGEYTSEETRLVAERIVSRNDILATAIGRPKKPGSVRGVGGGIGIKQFFGGTRRRVNLEQLTESDKMVLSNEFKKELFPKLKDELLSEIKYEITSLGLTIQGPAKGVPPIGASTKESYPLPEESGDGVDVPVDCELYVDDPPDIWWP